MDNDKKKDYIRTILIAGFFLIFGILVLDMMIGMAMEPSRP